MNQQNLSYSHILKPSPKKKQAILIPADDDFSLIDYVVGVGQIVGPENIISASKISNKRICMYLKDITTVDGLIKSSPQILVNNVPVQIRRLVAPSRRIILSNVHTCIPNSVLLEALRNTGVKTTSAIHDLHIGLTSESIPESVSIQYKHIASFRRAVYIADDKDLVLPGSLLIELENETYRIFINEPDQKCHTCGNTSHIAANCSTVSSKTPNNISHYDSSQSSSTIHTESNETFVHNQFNEQLAIARRIRDQTKVTTSSYPATQENENVSNSEPVLIEAQPTANEPKAAPEAMEITASATKRPRAPSSGDTLSQKSQETSKSTKKKTKNNRKKEKLATTDSADEESSTNEESPSMLEILEPARPIFTDPAYSSPMSFEDLTEFITQCNKPKYTQTIIHEFTSDIPAVLDLLNKTHSLINDRKVKNRITRMKKALTPQETTQLPYVSNDVYKRE